MINIISRSISYFSNWNCRKKKVQDELPRIVSDAAQFAIRSTALQPVLDSLQAQKIEKAFETDFLCRIVGQERADLKIALMRLPRSFAPGLLKAFKTGHWDHPVFHTDNWPLLVMGAYIEGQLDEGQVSKLFLFDACRNYPHFQIHECVDRHGNIQDKSGRLLVDGLGLIGFRNYNGLFNLNRTNTQFFSFKIPKISKKDLSEALRQGNANLYQVFHVLDQKLFVIDRGDTLQVLIIPPDLWDCILQFQYGSNAILSHPVLGYQPNEEMDHPQKRVTGIPCRYVKDPAAIHEIPSKHCGLYGHDGYHLAVESANIHRRLWIELKKNAKVSALVREAIGDRDFPLYCEGDPGRKLVPAQIIDAQKFWYVFSANALFCRKENKIPLLRCLFNETAELAAGYGITFESLKKCAEEESNSEKVSVKPLLQTANEIHKELFLGS